MSQDLALPITTLLPESAAEPVVLYDQHAALRFAIVERDHTLRINAEEWDRPGVYILLDPPSVDGSWGCYVGKAPAGIRTRLRDHLRNKDHWRRAVLIQRDTTFGFNSAQVAWLEGRLYDLLDAAEDARPHNGNRPSDETLPPFERASLENAVVPISRILRLIGYDPATADDSGTVSTTTKSSRTSRFYGITLKNVVDAGYLTAGARVVSTNSVWPADGIVNGDGTLTVNGTPHPTPSAAAGAVKGGAANGWDFWAVEDGSGRTSLATLRARFADTKSSPSGTE
ncbi:hypothetical protein F4692_000753 [Nocardioides cavernae]|uniref:RAMA domain-containing protein n=1 Tax=Nocardioides cavernae TaxID=1921566 RepID=A0A7Y9H206_9ACTN|nr:hypothetical protein [Nocardioides cavernae]NYE35649.1 hypothetical protein [Nocardioides cavernae]